MPNQLKEHTYYITGMHCPSCEIIIERKLLELDNIHSVDVSLAKNQATIEYTGDVPTIEKLNNIFTKEGYKFFENSQTSQESQSYAKAIIIGIAVLGIFFLIQKLGLGKLINVNSQSSLPAFVILGLIAGISSCAALVGGLILSMSKQWSDLYGNENFSKKIQPHLLFNLGRLSSYFILGGLLGLIGKSLNFSPTFSAYLVIVISIFMIFIAVRMLGINFLRKIQLTAPKFITRYVANEKNFKGKYMPALLGAGTFFLPCGFTITVQGLALISGNFFHGGLIMLLFALGTAPSLLAIGLASVKFLEKERIAEQFVKVAALVILVLALFNINSQFNTLGFWSLSSLSSKSSQNQTQNLAPVVDGKQVIKMEASAYGYQPNSFTVKANIPVRWEITDTGTSGCTNAIISRNLFGDTINLTPGKTVIKEFTPQKTGTYKFSCWMGMISGEIDVVDSKDNSQTSQNNINSPRFGSGAISCH